MNPPDEDSDTIYYRTEPQRFDKATPEIYFSRKYTPFEVNEQLRTFKIIVKLEPFGKMSKFFTSLHVGSVCEFKGSFEAFNYVHEKIENYIVFTQGKIISNMLTWFLISLSNSRYFDCVCFSASQRNHLRKRSKSSPCCLLFQEPQSNIPPWRFLQTDTLLVPQTSYVFIWKRWGGNPPQKWRENTFRETGQRQLQATNAGSQVFWS